jgi:hypothetical protein
MANCVCKWFYRLPGPSLLLAGIIALPVSTAIAHGQTDKPLSDVTTAMPHPEICDSQEAGDQKKLSTKSAGRSTGKEGQDATDSEPASAKRPFRLSAVGDSTFAADQQNPQCKPEHNDASKRSRRTGSIGGTDQPVFPHADSTAPIVSYSDGELTVAGHGARLGQILETIKALTGIALDVPPGSTDNQIFDDVGPAPIREALRQLLDGAKLNYVIRGSAEDPQSVKQLILTARTGTVTTSGPPSANGMPTEEASGPALYGEGFGEAINQPAVIEPVVNTANAIPLNVNIQQQANASGKTPGQILDELQKKQLQQLDDQATQTSPH